MATLICSFAPVAGTCTPGLLDAWDSVKRLWRAARERGLDITGGLKSNRALRVPDPAQSKGWRWQTLAEYVAGVYAHGVSTTVRKLYRCQVVVVRESLGAPLAEVRDRASSDLSASLTTGVSHIAARWDSEVLFGDTKELLGLDQYQGMSAEAIRRFWTLVLADYLFLDEVRDRLSRQWQRHVTGGEARREVQRLYRRHMLNWIYQQLQTGVQPEELYEQLAA
jgi:hypothetical protein